MFKKSDTGVPGRAPAAALVLVALTILLYVCPLAVGQDKKAAPSLAPDGGPWAPLLFDSRLTKIEPSQLEKGQDLRISMQFRPEHAERVSELSVRLLPNALELNLTRFYDWKTGKLEATIPARRFGTEGKFKVRMFELEMEALRIGWRVKALPLDPLPHLPNPLPAAGCPAQGTHAQRGR